jgi:hypothetical protein
MGCEIYSFAEVKINNKWEKVYNQFSLCKYDRVVNAKEKCDNPFYWQRYSMFSFLANVRNDRLLIPICYPRGLPNDVSDDVHEMYKRDENNHHSSSYITCKELLEFNYNEVIVMLGKNIFNSTYKEELGSMYFKHLNELKQLGNPDNTRIVIWFK